MSISYHTSDLYTFLSTIVKIQGLFLKSQQSSFSYVQKKDVYVFIWKFYSLDISHVMDCLGSKEMERIRKQNLCSH